MITEPRPQVAAGRRMDTAAVKGAFWLASDQLGSRLVDMVFAVVLARLLFPEAFGLFALAATSTAFFRLYANMGLGAAIVQRRQVDQEYLSTAYWANLASGALLFLLIAATGGLLGTFLREPRVGMLVLVLSSRFLIAAGAATQMALFSRRMDFRALALRSILATTAGGVTGVSLALAGVGVWSLVGQEVARVTVNTALLYRATGWRPTAYFSWSKFVDLWSFGGPVLLSRLCTYLVRHSDNLLVGRYLGATALGYYAFGFTLFAAPLNDVGAIVHRVMFSALSRLHGDEDRFKRGFLLATRYVTMLMMPAMIGLALVAPLLVGVIFGAKWVPSGPVVSILALGGFLGMLTALGPSGVQASGRPDLHLRRALYGVLVYLPAFAIGLRWGIVGVAVGYLAGSALLAPIGFRFMVEATGVDLAGLWDALAPSLVSSAAMAAAVAFARWALAAAGTPEVLALAMLILLGVVVYWAALWLINRQAVLGLVRVVRDSLPARGRRLLGQAE